MKRPLFAGAAYRFNNRPKAPAPAPANAPPATSTPAADEKEADKPPPPPKADREEVDETDDWIRQRIQEVKEQKRKDAEAAAKAEEANANAAAPDATAIDAEAASNSAQPGAGGGGKDGAEDDHKDGTATGEAAGGDSKTQLDEASKLEMIKRLGLSDSDAEAFRAFRAQQASEVDRQKDTLAKQYADFLQFQEARQVAELQARMQGMNARIAKLEVRQPPFPTHRAHRFHRQWLTLLRERCVAATQEAKLKHRMNQQRKRAAEMEAWEKEAVRLKEEVRRKRAEKQKRKEEAEAEAARVRREKFMARKAKKVRVLVCATKSGQPPTITAPHHHTAVVSCRRARLGLETRAGPLKSERQPRLPKQSETQSGQRRRPRPPRRRHSSRPSAGMLPKRLRRSAPRRKHSVRSSNGKPRRRATRGWLLNASGKPSWRPKWRSRWRL